MKRGVWILAFLVCIGLVLSLPPPPPSPLKGNDANQSDNLSANITSLNNQTILNIVLQDIPNVNNNLSSDSLEYAKMQKLIGSNDLEIVDMQDSLAEMNLRLWILTAVAIFLFLLLILFIILTRVNARNIRNTAKTPNNFNTSNNINSSKTVIVSEALKNYVQTMRSKGVPKIQLKQKILQAGYSAEVVELALKNY